MKSKLLPLIAIFLFAATSFAQEPEKTPVEEMKLERFTRIGPTGFQTEPRLISVPKVEYPVEAHSTVLEGTVRVRVSVSPEGIVLEVEEPRGPSGVCDHVTRPDVVAMRRAAKAAAYEARYEPATVDGKGVASRAFLTFEFVAPEKIKKKRAAGTDGGLTIGVRIQTSEDAAASPAPKDLPDVVSGGVLNGKAVLLEKPVYPRAARAVRAAGTVSIQVLIDTDGKMFSAYPVSGHPLLRGASEIAACGSTFTPTRLSGKPVKVSGIITYNFIP